MAPFLMHECLERAADGFGDRVAIRSGDESWTFGDLEGLSNAFAHHLAGRGVAAGHRVALMMANRVEFVIAVNGIAKLGAAAVLLSPAWKAAEVHHAVGLTSPVHAVGDADSATLLTEALTAGRVDESR